MSHPININKYVPTEEHERKSDPHPQYLKRSEAGNLVSGRRGPKGDPGEDGAAGQDATNLGIIDGGFANSTYGPGGIIDSGGA